MKTPEELRRQRNEELTRRFMTGESVALVPAAATFFPSRPIIKKDPDAVRRLFGKGDQSA